MSDRLLIERHAQGDPNAFEEIVRLHWSEVASLAARWLGPQGAEAAEDVATEVFVLLHGELDRWRGEGSLRTWLYRATLNKCGNRLREMGRRRSISERMARRNAQADAEPPPEDSVQRDEQSRRLQRALQSLPDKNRTVVVLFHYKNLTLKQISELMGISVSTVKRKLLDSLRKLKRTLL